MTPFEDAASPGGSLSAAEEEHARAATRFIENTYGTLLDSYRV